MTPTEITMEKMREEYTAPLRERITELEQFKRDATDRLQVLTMALMRIECETDCDHARALAKAAFWQQLA